MMNTCISRLPAPLFVHHSWPKKNKLFYVHDHCLLFLYKATKLPRRRVCMATVETQDGATNRGLVAS